MDVYAINHFDPFTPNYGSPLDTGEVNCDRRLLSQSGSSGGSGDLLLVYFRATKSEVIASLQMYSTGTAAGAQTSCRMGVLEVAANGDLTRVARTADDATMFTTTYAAVPRALEAPWTKHAGRIYATAVYSVAATRPTFITAWPASGMGVQDTILAPGPRLTGRIGGQSNILATYTAAQVLSSRVAPLCEMFQ